MSIRGEVRPDLGSDRDLHAGIHWTRRRGGEFGPLSGAHLNPAVTFGFWIARRVASRMAGAYVAAQLLGGVAASLALRAIVGDHVAAAAMVPAIGRLPALLVEGLLTFFLMVVILAVATDARIAGAISGLAIGLTVGFDALMAGPRPEPA